MPTGYVYDEIYQQHDTRDHVEGKDRLTAINAVLEKTIKDVYDRYFHGKMVIGHGPQPK
jgi:hypothetical protein